MKKPLKALNAITVVPLFGLLLVSSVMAEELNEAVASESFSVFKNVDSEDVKSIGKSTLDKIRGGEGEELQFVLFGFDDKSLSFTRNVGTPKIQAIAPPANGAATISIRFNVQDLPPG